MNPSITDAQLCINGRRPCLLTFVNCYIPDYKCGGPVRTVSNMVEQLEKDYEFLIVTRDRNVHDQSPYTGIKINDWNRVGAASVYYASPDRFKLKSISRLIRETPHDVLYLNSFFNPSITAMPLVARRLKLSPPRPVVIAPRGEFSRGALSLKALKKKIYITTVRMTGVYRGLTWQASSSDELIDIRQTIGSLAEDIVVAPNLVPKNNFAIRAIKAEEVRRKPGPLRIVFLSRISPMKNLDYLLRVLQRVKISAEFNIYGPNGDRVYWQECRQLIKMLPGNIRTVYHGALDHSKVSSVFRSHDVFVFPTRGENFGHVVYEALTAGAAVIISDRTPWRADDAGGCQVIPLNDFNGYVAAIERLAACSNEQLARLHEAAILHALRHDTSSDTLKANLDLFRSAISKFNFEAQNSPFR